MSVSSVFSIGAADPMIEAITRNRGRRPSAPRPSPIAARHIEIRLKLCLRSVQAIRMEAHHGRSRTVSPRHPRLAGGQLSAGNAASDDFGGRYVLGRAQRAILLRAAAGLVRADARQG